MTSLLHEPARVQPTLRLIQPPAPDACPSKRYRGEWCYKMHPTDMGHWCDECLAGEDPEADELPDWMGGVDTVADNAPAEPRLPMPDWIEVKAQELRLLDSNLADWLADRIDALADECRRLRATTPDEFDARCDALALADLVAEHDRIAEMDLYPHGVC